MPFAELRNKVQAYLPPEKTALVEDAYQFALKAHQGQVRQSGEPYLEHPLQTALILAEVQLDAASLAAEVMHMIGIIFLQPTQVFWPAFLTTDAVQVQRQALKAQRQEQLPSHINHFGVKSRVITTNSLIAKLVVLPVSPGLRSLIPKNGGQIIQLYRLGQIMQPVFQVGPAHRRRALRPEGYFITSLVLKGIHFLFHDIRSGANRTNEKTGVLKGRAVNTLIAVELADIDRFLLYVAPIRLFTRQNICGSARCLYSYRWHTHGSPREYAFRANDLGFWLLLRQLGFSPHFLS